MKQILQLFGFKPKRTPLGVMGVRTVLPNDPIADYQAWLDYIWSFRNYKINYEQR